MKILNMKDLEGTQRQVFCPNGGFISHRALLEEDKMGYTVTKTVIPPMGKQFWHYKNHLESCYCVSGLGVLTDIESGEEHMISPDTFYVLNNNDPHYFEAIEEVTLICIFNPPLTGNEVHNKEGSYE